MNRYSPNGRNRRSIRLRGYDYSQRGLYFITICVQNRVCLFGEIIDGNMSLNPGGEMIVKWVSEIENKFIDVKIPSFIVMPNHFHAIVANANHPVPVVGADLCVCPDATDEHTGLGEHGGLGEPSTGGILGERTGLVERTGSGEHIGSPLRRVVQWFKTMTTNEYIRGIKTLGWERFDKKLWQRNYYEHIIRNENDYVRIAEYINNNPAKWFKDRFYNEGEIIK